MNGCSCFKRTRLKAIKDSGATSDILFAAFLNNKSSRRKGNLHFIDVQVDIGLFIKNFRVFRDKVLNELSKQHRHFPVTVPEFPHLLQQLLILLFLCFQVLLSLLNLLFVLRDTTVEVVHQVSLVIPPLLLTCVAPVGALVLLLDVLF